MIVFPNEKNDLNSSKFQFKEPNLNYIHQSISAHNFLWRKNIFCFHPCQVQKQCHERASK